MPITLTISRQVWQSVGNVRAFAALE